MHPFVRLRLLKPIFLTLLTFAAAALTGCNQGNSDKETGPVLRIGFFPNITHAQALAAYHETLTKGTEGAYEKATGAKIEWTSFNAGPSAIEALLAGSIDAAYVGPNPVLNGYIRTRGEDIRVLTGSARGGVSLVVQPGSGLKTPSDFRGKRIATPQLGNTQDVAARVWLKSGGLKLTTSGGDAFVIPTANANQLDLFKQREVDGVWTVEPWVSRLELEARAERILSQDDAFITLLATGRRALLKKSELLAKLVAAHEALTAKLNADPEAAKTMVNAAFEKTTTRAIPQNVLDRAWSRIKFTTAINRADFEGAMNDANAAGLLPKTENLDRLFVKP